MTNQNSKQDFSRRNVVSGNSALGRGRLILAEKPVPSPFIFDQSSAISRAPGKNIFASRDALHAGGTPWRKPPPSMSSRHNPKLVQAITRSELITMRRVAGELAIALQRVAQLQTYSRLRKQNVTAAESARLVGSSVPTIWRYANQFQAGGWGHLVPQTSKCGRKPGGSVAERRKTR
jgi:hypothetical protein